MGRVMGALALALGCGSSPSKVEPAEVHIQWPDAAVLAEPAPTSDDQDASPPSEQQELLEADQ